MAVGRRRTIHKNLPPRLHLKRGRYYYGRNQEFLADNLADALRGWAEREAAKAGRRPRIFRELAQQYQARVIPTKAPRTQADNLDELGHLLSVFAEAPLEAVLPEHIRGYLDSRMAVPRKRKPGAAEEKPRPARTRANREIALFSAIWNWGRDCGMMAFPNPCDGVKRHKEDGRDRYVTNEELAAVWEVACEPLRDALDLHYLTGQRPADVLRMSLRDLRDGCLWVRQGKTKKPLRVLREGPLAAVLDRIQARTYKVTSLALVRNEAGQPLTYDALFNRFEKARELAGIHFQLRDLRAKAATDLEDLALAQRLLGHTTRAMTERYVKDRIGDKVRPLLRTGREIADKK